jgi:hypothetical protein
VVRDIRLCCLARADIEVASHDPPWNSTVEKSLCGQFEVAFLIRLEDLGSNLSTLRKVKSHVDIKVNGSVIAVLPVSEPFIKIHLVGWPCMIASIDALEWIVRL